MAKTLTTMQNEMYRVLNVPSNWKGANVPDGVTAGSYTYTTAASFTDYLNEGADELCRSAYLLFPAAPGTVSVSIGDKLKNLSALTLSGVREMRAAYTVQYTASSGDDSGVVKNLQFIDWNTLRNNYPNYLTDANGTPAYWYEVAGADPTVGIYPPAAIAGTLTVNGPCLPTYLSSGSDTFAWLSEQWDEAIVYYAASRVAIQAMDDPRVQLRQPAITAEYQRLFMQVRSQQDPWLAKLFLSSVATSAAVQSTPSTTK